MTATAQEKIAYQKPPKEILELVDVSPAPTIYMDTEGAFMVFAYRDAFKTLSELSAEEMRLGGLRVDPNANISRRITFCKTLKVMCIKKNEAVTVSGLPEQPSMAHFVWSPDQSKMAFTHTNKAGVSLWVLDVARAEAYAVSDIKLNANLGIPFRWFKDSRSLLVKVLPKDRKPILNTAERVPSGPVISLSEGGKAQNRTYQDLLKNTDDEHNFEQLVRSELVELTLGGELKTWAPPAMYSSFEVSPNGQHVLLQQLQHPFSYIVPYQRFPQKTTMHDRLGKESLTVHRSPLIEEMPQGFMATIEGKRNFQWRSDAAATLIWVEALDKGNPEVEAEYRDEVFQWEAPFQKEPFSILKTKQRFALILWATKDRAIAYDVWWNSRNSKTYLFDPSRPHREVKILFDRNYQDRYSDPGDFVMKENEYGEKIVDVDENTVVHLIGEGYSEKGQFPFIDELNLTNSKKKRRYQSTYTDRLERIVRAMDLDKGVFLVRVESPTAYPNYYKRTIKGIPTLQQVTQFENPYEGLQNIHKEVLKYKRKDGLELSGTLYLPTGHDRSSKEKIPAILWAYPREFKDKDNASQNTANPNSFTYPYWGSVIYWVKRGYAVLDGASFPIVGEGEKEPNDSFIAQLVDNAQAAIDALDNKGAVDRNRIAVGGHSYGAFMTANLLSHSDLFAAGIARSGAYNRTLTPFGFQSEERNYWEAPQVYNSMSPFMHADKMKTPLLLIHGQEDNNSGTYPLQSERYFNALKGFGATTRLVMLPKESHAYAAKESILHLLWEQDQWLEKHVKNRFMTQYIS